MQTIGTKSSNYLDKISNAIFDRLGIKILPKKYYLLELRLQKLIEEDGYADVEVLWQALAANDKKVWDNLARHITTTHTYFFREADQMDYSLAHLRKFGPKSPRIWCAASSSGEEPYSISMLLSENGFEHYQLVASDINKTALSKANEGIFDASRLEYVAKNRISRWFKKLSESSYQISRSLREHIAIKQVNIVEPVQFPEQFDIVFCRNVMIYFDSNGISRAVANLCSNLKVGGLLILGKTEFLREYPAYLERVAASIYTKIKEF